MNILVDKIKEVLQAVVPITLIVLLLNFTITPLETPVLLRFLIGAFFIIAGLSTFLFGVDIGLTPIGNELGDGIVRSNKLWIVIFASLALGFFVSIAEPDLHILAGQVEFVTAGLLAKPVLIIVVSVGIAVMLMVGMLRIVYNIPLYILLTISYGLILVLALFTSPEFLAISFDSSGATTGALTVPFILAMAIGASELKKDSKASEKDSFGLVAIASIGAIVAVMVMNLIAGTEKLSGTLEEASTVDPGILAPFIHHIPVYAYEIVIALLPIVISFFGYYLVKKPITRRALRRIIVGLIFTFIGLVLFLAGVNQGFLEAGRIIGQDVAQFSPWLVIGVGFVLGFTTILAEPAVHVLTQKVEDVTSGYVQRKLVLGALAIGVGFAIALTMIRILIPGVQLWHYLLPGYLIAIALMYVTPKLFVGIAFDSGGVASGPMTATFILAFSHGVAAGTEHADVLVDGFGMIAMVALTPLIALQLLGLIYKTKSTNKEA